MRVIETKVYELNELNESAKQKAREWYSENCLDYEWWDSVFEDAKTIGAMMGIEIDKIYFSGFYSQGDGACFSGKFSHKEGSVKAVTEHAPLDTALHDIAERLEAAHSANNFAASGSVSHDGYYYHHNCTRWDFEDTRNQASETALELVIKSFMKWIYKQLRDEYEGLTSNESVDATITSNEYTFTESGKRFG
jgi:hypothetical protein